MEIIITFFRDVLNGPVYIVVSVIAGILICSCIGYLAEKSINEKKERSKYAQIANPNLAAAPQVATPVQTVNAVGAQPVTQPPANTQNQ